MKIHIISFLIISLVLTSQISSRANTDNAPLKVDNVRVGNGFIEYDLYNVSGKPITAWDVLITIDINGLSKTIGMGYDYFISTEFDISQRSNEGGHFSGALQVDDFHHHLVPISVASELTLESINIEVTSVVFDDASAWGDPVKCSAFFDRRKREATALNLLLFELDDLQDKPDPFYELNNLKLRLNDELGNPTQVRTVRALSTNDVVRTSFLKTLENYVSLVDKGYISAKDALVHMREIVKMQLNAAKKHIPK